MARGIRWFGGLMVALGAMILGVLWVYRDVPAAEVEARWAGPAARFIEVDGVRLHYRDEGEGPVIVLLHANYASLFMWQAWVDVLRDHYRVIRLDLPAHGLTGPEPNGDYRLERIQYLFETFVRALELPPFSIAGASIGGTVAMRYAVDHPDQVTRLILISPGSLEARVRGRTTPAEVPRVADVLTYVMPRAFTEYLLANDYGEPSRLDPAIVDEWHAMWMREGNRRAMLSLLRQYVSGGVEDKIRAVDVPVLLIWGEANRRVPLTLAYETRDLMQSAPAVELQVLPGVGHMLVQEAPQASAAIIKRYLDQTAIAVQAAGATASIE